jgi:hypothetical protein
LATRWSNASSIFLHLIVIELMSFKHYLLAGGHRRSERLGPNIGCIYAGQFWVACLEGKRYGQEKVEPVKPRPRRANEGGELRL